ncbi:MAG: ABC transporter ATP-binding protein [Sporolactobacillus sp.]
MRIQQLTYRYPKAERPLFADLNWQLAEGAVNVLIGPNGAGKTTLLDLIAGTIRLRQPSIQDISPRELVYQLQGVPILNTITGRQYVALLLGADGRRAPSDPAHAFTELTPDEKEKLADLWKREYGQMSPGERRWLMIQCFVQYDRRLYLFDEPTAGVDRRHARLIAERINYLAEVKQRTVIYTTHLAADLAAFAAPQLFLLENGDLAACRSRLEDGGPRTFLHDFFEVQPMAGHQPTRRHS